MADQIYIGNFAKGFKTNPLPFNLDNDAFPTMFNMYCWRGRAKRKRGTSLLARLQRQIQSVAIPNFNLFPWQFGPLALVAGAGNLITGPWTTNLTSSYSLEVHSSIAPGTITLTVGGNTYTEPNPPDGTLLKNGVADPNSSINYATGAVFIQGGGVGPLIGTFSYFPDLPVMGLRDFVSNSAAISAKFPLSIGFDTKYAYQLNQVQEPPFWYNVSYYKNSNNPLIWSSDDSALFWSTNYQSAFWATNNKSGLHFLNGTYVSGSGTTDITFNFQSLAANFTTLVTNDVLFFNEWNTPTAVITGATQTNPVVLTAVNSFSAGQQITIAGVIGMTQLNTGTFTIAVATPTTITLTSNGIDWSDYVSGGIATLVAKNTIDYVNGTVTTNLGAGNYVVHFDDPQTVSGTGIVQMLTNSIPGQDGIRWYDGDPTAGTGLPTGTNLGWVNFAPPLTNYNVGINDQIVAKYYLVGALAIVAFKDRLLFFGPQIQAINGINGGNVIQRPLQDTVIWSWNGTPYYNELVPTNLSQSETFDNTAYFVDQTGKGGYQSAGISQPIVTVLVNEDVLLVGFGGTGRKTRFVYTGNDLQPFLFYLISAQFPSASTFSGINLDNGGIEIGQYGITITTQQTSQRIDMDIPDSVFQIAALNNGQNRVNAVRDVYREWIYFSYPTGNGAGENGSWVFPSQTFMWNYRDNTWAIFRENFTAHGTFRKTTGNTWFTISEKFGTWDNWREPWNAGSSVTLFPSVIAGNPQGYVLIKDQGTGEGISGAITAIANDGNGFFQITSINHCVNSESSQQGTNGDYLFFSNIIGTVGTALNGKIGLVTKTLSENIFVTDIPFVAGTYLGLGNYTRLIQPLIQTKQFPVYWQEGRQVRLSVQKYLMETTFNGEVTININLSQDPDDAWNEDPVLPSEDVTNSALIYTQKLYTCPESTNIGLTPANTNLQMPIAQNQKQIWHRMNTSLIGDTFQIGITLNDTQMRNKEFATSEIALHGMQFTVSRAGHVA